jgi:hypothetical protein
VGAAAVDLLGGMNLQRERGLPRHPTVMMIEVPVVRNAGVMNTRRTGFLNRRKRRERRARGRRAEAIGVTKESE